MHNNNNNNNNYNNMYLSLVHMIIGTIYRFAPGCHGNSLVPFNMYDIYMSFSLLPFNTHDFNKV